MSFIIGIIAYTIAIVTVTIVVTKELVESHAYKQGHEQGALDGVHALGEVLEQGMKNEN